MLQIGDKAPDFCLEDPDRGEMCLKDLKGKWVVLYFYPNDNTSGCTLEALEFTAAEDDFKAKNTVIIGVSPDSLKSYLRHIEVITDPQPGGPYLINEDNLTKPVTITLQDTNKTINILSDTPVIINASSQTDSQRWEPDWSTYTPAAVLVTLIAIAIYLVNSRRLERANRQIQ